MCMIIRGREVDLQVRWTRPPISPEPITKGQNNRTKMGDYETPNS